MTTWSIEEIGPNNLKITNLENGQSTVFTNTSKERVNSYHQLETIGFNKKEKSQIYSEILKISKPKEHKTEQAIQEFTDYLEMAKRFIQTQPVFYTPQKIWWMWNFEKKCWEMVDEIDLLNEMNKVVNLQLFKNTVKTEILNALKMAGRKNTPKPAPKTWIQFRDKICDVRTSVVFEAAPEYFITNPIPWKLGEKTDTPNIDRLFREWVEPEFVETLYEILAYCMLSDYPIHRVFCLNGEGRNGKGTYLHILTKLIGEHNVCSTDFEILTTNRFESSKLYKKLMCQMGEINSSIFKRTSLLKKLTGADLIGYEMKGKNGFDDYNYAKLIIATNKLPESTDKTVGFYARWMIVDFNNRFKENPNLLDCIPEEEYCSLSTKCLQVLRKLLVRGEFSNEGEISERAKRYEERSSPIREFLRENCEVGVVYSVPFWRIYKEYVAFLSQRGFRIATKMELSRLLQAKNFLTKRVHYEKEDGTKSTYKVVEGIRLVLDENQDTQDT